MERQNQVMVGPDCVHWSEETLRLEVLTPKDARTWSILLAGSEKFPPLYVLSLRNNSGKSSTSGKKESESGSSCVEWWILGAYCSSDLSRMLMTWQPSPSLLKWERHLFVVFPASAASWRMLDSIHRKESALIESPAFFLLLGIGTFAESFCRWLLEQCSPGVQPSRTMVLPSVPDTESEGGLLVSTPLDENLSATVPVS